MRTLSLHTFRLVGAVGAVLLSMGTAKTARATVPECSSLENVVFVTGSTAVKPFLGAVAASLVQLDEPINIVYIGGPGSCAGVAPFTTATGAPAAGTPSTWNDAGMEQSNSCTLPTLGAVPDIGVSDVYADTCGYTLASNAADFYGPIQSMTFVTPKKSTQPSISAEAAYLTFGFGADGNTPWNDPAYVFVRSATSGTQQMLATAIQVPAAKWKSPNALSGSGAVRDALNMIQQSGSQANADLAIGILSSDIADGQRATLKVLPYQHFEQTCGFLPDSTATAHDKQNVRDGHYMIWGPLHMFARVTGGVPDDPNVKKIIDILSGAEPADFLMPVIAAGGVVPDCAMRVTRDEEVGPLSSYMPPQSCECAYLTEATGETPDGCTACADATECPASKPACNYNFCEVR